MGQIDYFFRWASEADAKQDALMLADYLNVDPQNPTVRDWARDRTLPNVKAWRVSQDVHNPDGTVTHTYLAGWFAIISIPRQVTVLLNASALAFCLDRDACLVGQPFVIRNNIGAVITDVGCEPIFAGSKYPIGGYN